jgi:hypothetical protein
MINDSARSPETPVSADELQDVELLGPPPAQTNDGNPWVDGWCWLWCGFRYTRVLWIGTIGTPGAHAPLFACGPCIQLLHDSVWDYADTQHALPTDESGRDIPLYGPPTATSPSMIRFRRGRHRRPRTPLGQRFLYAITAPDDRTPLDAPLPVENHPEPAPPRAEDARRGAGSHPPDPEPGPAPYQSAELLTAAN